MYDFGGHQLKGLTQPPGVAILAKASDKRVVAIYKGSDGTQSSTELNVQRSPDVALSTSLP
jgi:hypothetical protein